MRKILLTTALVLPLGAGFGFAQTSTPVPADQNAAGDVAEAVDQGAAATAETAGDAAEAVTDAVAPQGSDVEQAGDEMEAEGDEAAAEADAVDSGAAATDTATTTDTTSTEMTTTETTTATDAATGATVTTTAPEGADAAVTTDTTTTTATTDATTEAAVVGAGADVVVRDQAPNELRVDWITGATVESPSGENIGSINDLIMDETGQITAAIVGVGGFLGIGEKQVAIDWANLQIDFDGQRLSTDLSREAADAAPGYVFRERTAAPAAAPMTGTVTDPAMPATSGEPVTLEADPAAPASN